MTWIVAGSIVSIAAKAVMFVSLYSRMGATERATSPMISTNAGHGFSGHRKLSIPPFKTLSLRD
ncbi:hypothetical protein DPMN_017312 [Dreissena polymorpha]|uniref:Uncharacterized protein n=1 Tax=Dreissena polymorpha TaxID=45954 RepID=A0A9D4NEL3_DREPO|nr:hypothetical protein DPMN_017312 [Dreissena polymorpha]